MNTQANVMPGSPLESQGSATAVIPASRLLYWSVRRELWENRSIYIAPLAVAALALFGFTFGSIAGVWEPLLRLHAMRHSPDQGAQPFEFAAALIMATAVIVSVFYSLDALYGERRDRSILFWKSLPVSDLTTVVAKVSVPLVVLPLVGFAITLVTQFLMLLVASAVLLATGASAAPLWTQLSLTHRSLLLLYHMVTVHGLWYAPFYAWFLLVSAFARRAPFLWAVLPPLAIGIVERLAFNSSHFGHMLMDRLGGGAEVMTPVGGMPMDPGIHLTPGTFLVSPGLWVGFAIAAAFLTATVRLRRSQGPI